MLLWVINDFIFCILKERKWLVLVIYNRSENTYFQKTQVSSLNRLKRIKRYNNFQSTWNILKDEKSVIKFSVRGGIITGDKPLRSSLVFQERQQPFQASAYWWYHRCRLMATIWSLTKTSVNGREKCKKVKYEFKDVYKNFALTCCGELKVGVIFPKLTELFSKWCDCWGDAEAVCSCKGVCGETGWMIWPLLLMLLLFAVFGLMLRVEFWAGELLPLPANRNKEAMMINIRISWC